MGGGGGGGGGGTETSTIVLHVNCGTVKISKETTSPI